ncbi:MAG: winged helix-turn-helix transcriptional regulator [Erysipelotrichaceae bacterium]
MSKIKNEYSCSLILSHDLIGGKWKLRILWHILKGDNRFSLLQKGIPDITHKMLITQLKELEQTGIVERTIIEDVRPHVEYSISQAHQELIPIVDALCRFALGYAKVHEIDVKE